MSKPSKQQQEALQVLESELPAYEQDAQEFEREIATIVRHHYQSRQQRAFAVLDREIKEQTRRLVQARDAAISRLEAFIRSYRGTADPVIVPDALYRLAALYEERAREGSGDLSRTLRPAIALYRQILTEFPEYQQLTGVHYYLGHALTDAGRLEEGQQAFRALVCHNRYRVQNDAKDREKVGIQVLPQDHDPSYWDDWAEINPVPLDRLPGAKYSRITAKVLADREWRFRDPYLNCETAQPPKGELEQRYVAEAWWQLGNYQFDALDRFAGPYALNRAVSAYQRSMEPKRPPLYGVALYKHAWALYRQQRYSSAVLGFVELLRHADEQQLETGDEGTDFRAEAYGYIAASLTYGDFDGPPADHPYIERGDPLDTVTDPLIVEQRMAIAIGRVQDPQVVPQDKKWAAEIYDALAREFVELGQTRNAISVLELALTKFPLHPAMPKLQNQVADLHEQLSRLAPERSSLKLEHRSRALDARTALSRYVGRTAWTQANRKDSEALRAAAELVRQGMQRVAVERTNTARSQYTKAKQQSSGAEQRPLVEHAISEYRLAATGWAAYLAQDPSAADSYESRFWLADARFWNVVLQLELGRTPSAPEIEAARAAAKDVRDSNDDDKYLQPAAHFLVTLADQVLEDRYRAHQNSGGKLGIEKRQQVQFKGEGLARRVTELKIPYEVLQAIEARDDYNLRVPYESDPQHNGMLYAFQAADHYFVYGQFAEAKRRLAPLLSDNCGKNEWGFRAWEKLVSMSNFQGDAEQSRLLVEQSCAFDEDTRAAEDAIRKPVRQGVAYLEARQAYDRAERSIAGPEREQTWRKAAALYKAALDAAPDRDEAPEAAMNGAFAYKQVGEYNKAIEMYELFISRYGSPNKLRVLREGEPTAKPPKAPEPGRYETRVKFLKLAYDALANAYLLFFDYPKAAETLSTVASTEHFSASERRTAAEQALNLYVSLGQHEQTVKSRNALVTLGASPKERALADFVIASAALKQWDAASPDSGANKQARDKAEQQLRSYYDAHGRDEAAVEYLVEAAYWLAKLKRAAKDPAEAQWWTLTEQLFVQFRDRADKNSEGKSAALGSRQAAFAAEGAFLRLDQELNRAFDREAGHHRFRGTPAQVIESYQQSAVTAKGWYDRLQAVIDDYASPEWATAAIARQGSLYDSLRTGLYDLRPPELQMFDKQTDALLRRAEESDNPALQEKADAIRTSIEASWRARRDQELDSADRIVVDRYSRAIVWARRYNVASPVVAKAIARMAFLTEVLGAARLQQYTAGVPELGYSEGVFLRMRPGLVAVPAASGMSPPSPVLAAPAGTAPMRVQP